MQTWPFKSNVIWTLSIVKLWMCLRAVKCNAMWVLYCCGSVWMTVLPFLLNVTLKQLVFRKQWDIQECCQKRMFWDTKLLWFVSFIFVVLFKNIAVSVISTNILLKLILRNSVFGIWGLNCFMFLYSVDWYLIMDALGKPINPSERVKNSKFLFGLHWHLKMVLIVCPEISVNYYQPTVHKNWEEWRPQCVFNLRQSKHYCGGSVCVSWIKLMEELGTFTPFINVAFASVCTWRSLMCWDIRTN